MRSSYRQMSLPEIFDGVTKAIEDRKPELIGLLETALDFDALIPASFDRAFYKQYGRGNIYHLDSLLKALLLQKLLGFTSDAQLLTVLRCSSELRNYCGFTKVPDSSQITRFKKNYCEHIREMFEYLVDVTEPICRRINEKKANYLIYDTTGIEPYVAENNPKFMNTKLKQAKKMAKSNPDVDPYRGVYGLLPEASQTNADARQQYINGHYCYAMKAGILSNGLGIVRGISFFDDNFRDAHPEVVTKKTENPDADKEIADSKSLQPVLKDFFERHSKMSFGTFLGDAAFDKYDTYTMLRKEFHFTRVCIPLNSRNSNSGKTTMFDSSGTPVCPLDNTPFIFNSICGGANRSQRFKWVCPKSVQTRTTRICHCDTPCTDSPYGRCVYTYPDEDFRLYPGIPRNTEHWNNLYRHRVVIERTINLLKDVFTLDERKSYNTKTLKADLFLAGIVQLTGVLLADALNKPHLLKSVRKLLAA